MAIAERQLERCLLLDCRLPQSLIREPAAFGGSPQSDMLRGDLLVSGGRVRRFLSKSEQGRGLPSLDLGGRLLVPRLVEPHVHLDKCYTIARLGNVGGDLAAAAERQSRDRINWSHKDIEARAERGLAELVASGCRFVRTHVDWPDWTPPPAWSVLGKLAERYAERVTLERVPLISLERFEERSRIAAVARTLASADGVLGVFVLDQSELETRLRSVLGLAERYGLALDFHVDEDLSAPPRGLAALVSVARETSYQGPILCGHACRLAAVSPEQAAPLIEAVAATPISVVALPATNLYLQGRAAKRTPGPRGLTRVHELRAAGVRVALGTDNVGDAFCPLGRFDPLHTLSLGALAAHLDPPYGEWLKLVTVDAALAVGCAPGWLDGAPTKDVLVTVASTCVELLEAPARIPLNEYLSAV